MSRNLLAATAALLIVGVASSAGAVTAKWCFKWRGSYADAGFGEDHLNIGNSVGPNEIAAKYGYVQIHKWIPATSTWEIVESGYLDTDGCTDDTTILGGTKYRFRQFLSLKRSSRVIEVHPDGQDWDGNVDEYVSIITTLSPLPVHPTYAAPVPPDSTNNRLMPAMTQVLSLASTLDIPDGVDIDVSTDTALGCGSWCSDLGSSHYHICVSDGWSNAKYNIAHELGHVVSKENDGPRLGDYCGSEGVFDPGTICDCSGEVGGYSHCPTSREFSGSGQKEGFSHFIAAASYNIRAEVSGVFVFYKNLREWTSNHGGTLPLIMPDSDSIMTTPYPGYLSTSDNVKWTEYECDPSGEDFEHYGNEWDWLSFFWNLWTDGGSNKFEVSQINAIWDDIATSDSAYFCCVATPDPALPGEWIPGLCAPRDMSAACGTAPNSYPYQFTIGKLWEADADFDVSEGVRNQAYSTYYSTNPTKYYHFRDSGIDARVNY